MVTNGRLNRVAGLLVAVVLLGACGKKPAPEQPVPASTTQPVRNNGTEGPATGGADAEAELRARIAASRATVEDRIYFAYDQSNLSDAAQSLLRAKMAVLRSESSLRVRVEGHADERGSVEYNLALGMRRAIAARDFLVGFGLDASRFEVSSLGEDRPLDAGKTEAAYARNRRDEFVIIGGSISGR